MGRAHGGSAATPARHRGVLRTSLHLHLRAYAFAIGKCCNDAPLATSTFSGLHIPISLGLRPHPMRKYSSLKPLGAAQSLASMYATLLSFSLSLAQSLLLSIFGSTCSAEGPSSSSCSRRFREHLRARVHRRQCADPRCTTRGATAVRAHQARLAQPEALLPLRRAT